MLKGKVWLVYWIRDKRHQDILVDGYVGVTSNMINRQRGHLFRLRNGTHKNSKIQEVYNSGHALIFEEVFKGTKGGCLALEAQLRPIPNVGWNILAGGTTDVPPSQIGRSWFTDGHMNVLSHICPKGFHPGKTQVFGINHGLSGKPKSAEHRAKISAATKGFNKGITKCLVICPYCGLKGGNGAMGRWHFSNCRSISA